MIEILLSYMAVLRPLSLTCGVMATLITTAVVTEPVAHSIAFTSTRFILAMGMAVSVQLGANLTNTYFDFKNGVDVVDKRQLQYRLDKGLANGQVSEKSVFWLMILFYSIGIGCASPFLLTAKSSALPLIFGFGLALAFFYTANPLGVGGLKYVALGDVTIFLCFGPLLMQCVSIILTGEMNEDLYIYTIPMGLLTEAILHANNSRDIATDTKAGVTTLAIMLGFDMSYLLYIMLLSGAYLCALFIACTSHWACVFTLLTAPIAAHRIECFKKKDMECLPQMTSKLHLPFGILLFLGIILSPSGIF